MSDFLRSVNHWIKESATVKLLIVGFLTLVLLIPASMVSDLVRERQNLRDDVVQEISSKWAGRQQLSGPVLQVPYVQRRTVIVNDQEQESIVRGAAYYLADDAELIGRIEPEQRARGIYTAVLYTGDFELRARFDSLPVDQLDVDPSELDWSRAVISFGLNDVRGIDSLQTLRYGSRTARFAPGVPEYGLLASGFQAAVDVGPDTRDLDLSFAFTVRGSAEISFAPVAAETRVSLTSNWGDPSFRGAFLPDERDVQTNSFTAAWSILEVNRPFARSGTTRTRSSNGDPQFSNSGSYSYNNFSDGVIRADQFHFADGSFTGYAFGVELLRPVDDYRRTDRATKYAALFVAATFLTFFFIEVLNGRRLHPVQYLLVGFAIVLFYVLLLSLSEHLGFAKAYVLSAALIVGLVTAYTAAVLQRRVLALLVAGVLAILYTFFFSLLQLEDYALLVGSFGLLIALATVMYLTRRINWHQLGKPAAARAPVVAASPTEGPPPL